MTTTSTLSTFGKELLASLQQIESYEATLQKTRQSEETVHVTMVGGHISSAYEQLRNASEYAEENLLLQRAIRRFLQRSLSFHQKSTTKNIALELITELTQAAYLANDTITVSQHKQLQKVIKKYYSEYWHYTKIETNLSHRNAMQRWILDVLTNRVESTLRSTTKAARYAHLIANHFQQRITVQDFTTNSEQFTVEETPAIIYIGVRRALLKSDAGSIRTALLDIYKIDADRLHNFEAFNRRLDALLESKTVAAIARAISKNGAPFRVLYSSFFAESKAIDIAVLNNQTTIEHSLHQHIDDEYRLIDKRLNSGIIKSIVFLLMTKALIGLAIEIPYDIAVFGHIILLPLLVNLFFPAIYILFSRLTLATPGTRNTNSIINYLSELLYVDMSTIALKKISASKRQSTSFGAFYGITFGIVLGVVAWLLYLLHFTIIQGVIFFVFFSTASFLGFRLSQQVREIEFVSARQSTISLIRDIIYLPFIYIGQQISDRYARVNIVATLLDMAIELPLKTVLRFMRQWTAFLNAKKDELG